MSENKNRNPAFTGSVQKKVGEDRYEQVGTIGVWENVSENPKAPRYTGKVELGATEDGKFVKNGQVRYVSLWNFKPKEDRDSEGDF